MNGFDIDALVARGVFASHAEYDRVMCALEEDEWRQRRGRAVVVDWLVSTGWQCAVQPQRREGAEMNFTAGGGAKGLHDPGSNAFLASAPSPAGSLSTAERQLCPTGYAFRVCAWCALEHVLQGHGPAPRSNGDIVWVSCERHSDGGPASRPGRNDRPTPTTPGAANALPHASAPGLPLPPCAEPFHPTLNPNAGVPLAFPKGRWS